MREPSPRHPLAAGFPEVRCPKCHAKLLDGYFLGLLLCRKCGEAIYRTTLPAAALARAAVSPSAVDYANGRTRG